MDAGNGANNLQIIDGKDIPGLRQAVCLKRQGWHPRVAPGGRQANAKDALLFLYLFVFICIWNCICSVPVFLISKAFLFCSLLQAAIAINKIGVGFVPGFVCITFVFHLHCICIALVLYLNCIFIVFVFFYCICIVFVREKPLGATALNAQKLQHIFAHIHTMIASCNGIFLSY